MTTLRPESLTRELLAAASTLDNTLPARLRAAARISRFPLTLLAVRVGLPYWRLERILNGRTSPKVEELHSIAGVLGVQLEDLRS